MSFIRSTIRCFNMALGLILIIMPIVSCEFSDRKNPDKTNTPSATAVYYKVPTIPVVLNTPIQRADFLVEHYWDNFEFRDTSAKSNPKNAELAFVDFISILRQVSFGKAVQGISILIRHSANSKKTFLIFLGAAEKYLHNPNSPFRNELFYEPFLVAALASDAIDSINKVRIRKQFDMARKNKPGDKAINFSFILKNGTTSALYKIKSELVLLYFHNPDCSECKTTRSKLTQSKVIRHFIEKGTLQILSVYPDPDLTLWLRHYPEMPASWINGYDKGAVIKKKELYDLKAIPTLYLLDGDKTVRLRDASLEEIEEYLLTLIINLKLLNK